MADVLTSDQVEGLQLGPLLGEGETSRVFGSAYQGRALAIKCNKPNFRDVLVREARALALVAGPSVPMLWGVGCSDEGVRLVMERLEGDTVESMLGGLDSSGERTTLCSQVFAGCAPVLMQLHALGWAHCDVKPANLGQRFAGDDSILLLDFGLASQEGTVRGGTPRYLPPEVFAGEDVSPAEADTYALFRTLAEILEPTFEPSMLGDWARHSEHTWHGLIASALARSRTQRPGLRALWQEATDRMLVDVRKDPEGLVRREYVATRLHEFTVSSARKEHSTLHAPTTRTSRWLTYLGTIIEGLERVQGASEARVSLPVGDLGVHDRRRFLVRLVGPGAADWKCGGTSDAELADALLRLGVGRDLRSVTRNEFEDALFDGFAGARKEAGFEALDDIEIALQLGRRPVSRVLLTDLAARPDLSERLRLEATRAARQMGDYALASRLLENTSSSAAQLQRSLLWLRMGRRTEALELAQQLAQKRSGTVQSHAVALLARAALDDGNVERALIEAGRGAPCAAVLEVKALALLASERYSEALACVDRGEALTETEEEAARLSAVRGMVAHATGQSEKALSDFQRAVEQANRAGAALEEATYCTGVAAAASDAVRLETSLLASERAEVLFEALRRPESMARAILARASVLSAVGAEAELLLLARRGLAQAARAGDTRCEAFLHLCLCDGVADLRTRQESAQQAERLLALCSHDDRLRAAARILRSGGRPPVEADSWANEVVQPEALLDWWGARAEAIEHSSSLRLRGSELHAAARPIVERLLVLSQPQIVSSSKGPALVAGALLALRIGDAESARVLLQRAAEVAQEFLRHVPAEHQQSAQALSWVIHARGHRLQSEQGGAQIGDVETLLRSLGRRDGFRGLLNQILDLLLLWTRVERGLLLLRAPGQRLVVRAARNVDRRDLSEEQKRLSFSMAERAVAERRPVVAVDAVADLPSIHRSVHALSLRSVLAVPLIARGEVLGVAYLDDRVKRGAFGERELSWANLISTVAALAIADERDRLTLERSLRRTKRAEARLAERLQNREAQLALAARELSRFSGARKLRGDYSGIIHRSPVMRQLLELVDRVAQSDVPALVLGESGTGKELIARAVAEAGPRKEKPFVAENCAAVPEGLLESTLFGHYRGAFTGATKNQDGLFVLAHGGTLFLDEIGEMSLNMQTKLLRVLQDGEVRPLGAPRSRPVDVRLIAATHRDLRQMVDSGTFREDLFYRLHVVQLNVPPLRERPEDIEPLVRHFLQIHGGAQRNVSEAALARLRSFAWPGNVRQLENEVRRMIVLGGDQLTVADLSPEVVLHSDEVSVSMTLREKVDALERRLLLEALEQTRGNRTRAAEILGISRFGLQKMTQRLEIEVSDAPQRSGRIRDRGLDDSQ